MGEMKDNGERKRERGGGKEEGGGEGRILYSTLNTHICVHTTQSQLTFGPMHKRKGKCLPKGKPLFSKCELPIFFPKKGHSLQQDIINPQHMADT